MTAQSHAVANAYPGFSQALACGALSARLREQIALTVGQANECGYCIVAHFAIGQKVGLSVAELAQARQGLAADDKGKAALSLARKLVHQRGRVTEILPSQGVLSYPQFRSIDLPREFANRIRTLTETHRAASRPAAAGP
jgi:AhpD family alkylhydroperoxidase